jgi:hypothetical protein
VTNTSFSINYGTLANFKSGQRTGCYNGTVPSIGVPGGGVGEIVE